MTETELVVEFGAAKKFDNGKGVLLPAKTDKIEFQELRRKILRGINDNPRVHEPHITLMHPGNSICTDNIFGQIEKTELPTKINFRRISLIEQKDTGPWNILQEFELQLQDKK